MHSKLAVVAVGLLLALAGCGSEPNSSIERHQHEISELQAVVAEQELKQLQRRALRTLHVSIEELNAR